MDFTPYIIKSYRGGLSDENSKGIAGSFKHGYGLDIHDRDDVLKCASTVATIDSSLINDLIRFFVPAKDGTTYAFGSAGSIYAISGNIGDPAVSFAYNDENGAIKGAAEWEESDGNNYLVWATNTSVARVLLNGSKDVPWAGAVQDYKVTLDPADWHTMGIASGQLNIANNNFLATIGYDGSFDPSALDIIPGNLIKAIEERDDTVVLGSERDDNSEQGHLWKWITTALNWIQKKKIPIKGVNALVDTENLILQGGTDGELFYSDFVNSVPIARVPGGGKVNPGGVSIDNDLALFGFFGGTYPGLFSYGRRMKNRPTALNFQYRLARTVAGSSVSEIGAVAVVNGLPLASWATTDGSTTDYGLDCVSSTTRATALYEGLEFDAGVPHLNKNFKTVNVNTAPLVSGTSYSIKYKQNKESDWRYAVLAGNSTTYSTADSVQSLWTIDGLAAIFEIGVDLNPSGSSTPEILNITTYVGNTGNPQ